MGPALAEEQVVRFTLDRLAMLEAESPGAWAPPATGRFSAGLAGLDVIAGRVLYRATVDLLPDVLQVVALAQGRDNCHYALRLHDAGVAELPIHIRWCMCDTRNDHEESENDHGTRVTKRPIKIRNEKRT